MGIGLGMAAMQCGAVGAPDQSARLAGGWAAASVQDARVQEAARFAVAARAQALGAAVVLLSVEKASAQVVAGTNFDLALRVREKGRKKAVRAVVWAKLDGSHTLSRWSPP